MNTRTRVAAVAALAVGTLFATTTVAAATEQSEYFCVIANNVNYRTGPGIEYPSLGQVNYGQGFNENAYQSTWWRGTLWGGPSNVWIKRDFLGWCQR
jgi:uncharacterized protein YraI